MNVRIIIPAWNEEGQIESLFHEFLRIQDWMRFPFQIYLIDDGSTDNTVSEAKMFESELPIRVISHGTNRGVSEAFRTGFNAALADAEPGDRFITMEANKNADPLLIPRMMDLADDGSDLVLASCYAPGGAVVGDPFLRLLLSKGINTILRVLFPLSNIHTYTSFYRLWSHDLLVAIRKVTNNRYFEQEGFVCMADMLLKARRIPNLHVHEIPMILKSDITESGSKMKVGRTITGYLKLVVSNLFR